MALSLALDVARSSLAATGEQLSIASRNIARTGDANATRKSGLAVTGPGSSVHIGRVDRATDSALLEKVLQSKSASSLQSEIGKALTGLDAVVGDVSLSRSPAALLGELDSSLRKLATSPNNAAVASSVVNAAKNLANSLNDGSSAVDGIRRQADANIAIAVDRGNELLSQFKALNDEVVQGVRTGADVTDAMDARDAVLKSLSEEVSINVLNRSDGDIAIFTDSGITLFDRVPRSITFSATPLLASGASGAAVYADGVPIAGAQNALAVGSGRFAGLISVRDDIAPVFQRQLDEIARGLISTFAEFDQSANPTLPPAAGLFTYPGGPAIPPAGSIVPGLAGMIEVNPNVDPGAGGNPLLVRDGGISDPGNIAYAYNLTGAASFTDRIDELINKIDLAQSFDPAGQIPSSANLQSYANNSVSWLEERRKNAKTEADFRNTVSERATALLSKETGVSLDEEMTNMLELERTFQASSRLISAIDTVLQSLIAAVR